MGRGGRMEEGGGRRAGEVGLAWRGGVRGPAVAVAVSAAETVATARGTGGATQNRVRQVRVRQVGFRWQSRSFGARRSGSMAVGPSRLGRGRGEQRGPEPLRAGGGGTPPPGATSWVPKEEKLSWRTGVPLVSPPRLPLPSGPWKRDRAEENRMEMPNVEKRCVDSQTRYHAGFYALLLTATRVRVLFFSRYVRVPCRNESIEKLSFRLSFLFLFFSFPPLLRLGQLSANDAESAEDGS